MKSIFHSLSVLIVDDDEQARYVMNAVLERLGVETVYEAESALVAQERVAEAAGMIDLVICDMKMPGMSGLEFLTQVRKCFPDMPFMMVTGNAEIDTAIEARNLGVDAYISKPFSPREIKEKLVELTQ